MLYKNVLLLLVATITTTAFSKKASNVIDAEFSRPKRERRKDPEWNDADNEYHSVYTELDFTEEEFWVERLWEKNGMVQIDDAIFDKYIGEHKEGDKTWIIAVGKTPYQDHDPKPWAAYNNNFGHMEKWMQKAMTFKLVYGDEYHVGFIDEGTHEHLKETFPHSMRAEGEMMHRKLPYLMMIKDGHVYYREPTAINQKGVHSFVTRDYPECRIQSGVRTRISPYMLWWEYAMSGVRDMVFWRKVYVFLFNSCSTYLEDPHRHNCREFFKWNLGPLVPNKTVG